MTRRWRTAAAFPISLLVLAGVALLATGCGSSSSSSSSAAGAPAPAASGGAYGSPAAPAKRTTTPTTTASALTIATRSTPIGTILTGANGRTVYLFEKDTAGKSNCAGACAAAWMPVAAPAAAGPGLTASMLSTTVRPDGKKQAVYGGHPLYYFVSDTQPGDTRGQGVHAFGADWYEIGPAGKKVEKPGS